MSIPFLQKPVFTFTGIEFDLGGGNVLTVRPHLQAGGDPSYQLSFPTEGVYLAAVDNTDTLRWSDGASKTILNIPVHVLGIGETGLFAGIHAGSLTFSRNFQLPDKNGTFAMLDDTMGMDPQYISGFGHRTTATTVVINAGRAYVESTGQVVEYAGGTYTYPGTIPNNTTVHFYLHSSGSVDISATGPGSPYFGTARSRSDSTARRYLFSVRSMPSGNQLYLQRGVSLGNAMDVTFVNNTGAQNMLVSNGTSTSAADVSAAAFAPAGVTTDLAIRVYNDGSAGTVRIYAWSGAAFGVWSNIPTINELLTFSVPCDPDPKLQYDVAGAAGARAQIALLGYRIER